MSETTTVTASPEVRTTYMPDEFLDDQGNLRIVLVGLGGNVHVHGVEAGLARLNVKIGERGFKGIVNRIWHGNIAREYYLNKYTREAEANIIENDNLLSGKNLSDQEMRIATTLRFADEYDSAIHEGAGEHREQVFDTNEDGTLNQEGQELKRHIVTLIEDYATGKFSSEADFNEARKRMMTDLVAVGAITKEYIEKNLGDISVYTDNILRIAQYVKIKADHEGADIQELLAKSNLTLGEARVGVRTELEQSAVERLTKKLEGKTFMSESTLATAVSVTYSIAGWASKSVVGAATKAIAPGIASGVWAGMREARMLKEERAQHSREMASGEVLDAGLSSRREALEQARYEAKSVNDLMDALGTLTDEQGILRALEGDELRDALQIVAECKARINLSDTQRMDLISYSSVELVDKERWDLDKRLAKIEVAMRNLLSHASEAELTALGISTANIPGTVERQDELYDDMLKSLLMANEGILQGEVQDKDRVYAKLRRKRVAAAVLKGTVMGISIGLLSQELSVLATHDQQGLVEGIMGQNTGAHHQTVLDSLYNTARSHVTEHQPSIIPHSDTLNGHYEPVQLGTDTRLMTPNGFHVEQHGNTITVIEPNGTRIQNLQLKPDGQLTTQAEATLKAAHLQINEDTTFISNHVVHEAHVSAQQFVDDNDTVKVTRDFWYDNGNQNTPTGSELGLQLPTVDSHGNYVISISGMDSPSYSSSGAITSWHELAAQGDLKFLVSATDGTQSRVFSFDIGPDGHAIIPAGSPAAQFFADHNGQVSWDCRYMEVAQFAGVDKNGIEHIRPLATAVGSGKNFFTENVVTNEVHTVTNYTLAPTAQFFDHSLAVSAGHDVNVPPVAPIYGRRGLEPLGDSETMTSDNADGGSSKITLPNSQEAASYYGVSKDGLESWLEENQARVRTRRRVKEGDSYRWYESDGSEVRRDVKRERETLKSYMDSVKEKDAGYYTYIEKLASEATMHQMSDDCRVSVNIPAWMEGKGIYRLLEMYTKQTDRNGKPIPLNEFEINIIVNRKTGTAPDNTVQEIERFLLDQDALSKGFKINYIDVEFDPPYNNVGHARHVITDLTLLRSLRRVNQDKPLYIESEDADIMRLDPHTVYNVIQKMDEKPYLDVVKGIEDRSPSMMQQNDYLFLSQRAWKFLEIFARSSTYRPENNPQADTIFNRIVTGGWNTAYSAEAYALIGGYDSGMIMGEDMMIGQRISAIRGDGSKLNTYTVETVPTRTDSSPRRFLSELITGQGAYSSAFGDEALNKFIREASLQELIEQAKNISRIDTDNEDRFKNLLAGFYQVAKSFTPNREEAKKLFARTMLFVGLSRSDYAISPDDETATIKSLDNVKRKLEEYRQKHGGGETPGGQTPEFQNGASATNIDPVLARLHNGDIFDASFSHYSGQMRFIGTDSSGHYYFEPIDASGRLRTDVGTDVLSAGDTKEALTQGRLAPAR